MMLPCELLNAKLALEEVAGIAAGLYVDRFTAGFADQAM